MINIAIYKRFIGDYKEKWAVAGRTLALGQLNLQLNLILDLH